MEPTEKLSIDADPEKFVLTMPNQIRTERLRIIGAYPRSDTAEMLFRSLGTMHLIAPYFPESISANFRIHPPIQELISAMYASEDMAAPSFRNGSLGNSIPNSVLFQRQKKRRIVVAYSAGKDSLWNLWRAIEEVGKKNVLAVHIRNLNKNNGSRELQYTKIQQKMLKFPNLRVIKLINGSRNTGFRTMRSRDIFLTGLIVPLALEFEASEIWTEGFAEETNTDLFTGRVSNMLLFNRTLHELHVPISIKWKNRLELDVVKDLYIHRPSWMQYVCNCFTIPAYQAGHRRNFEKTYPSVRLYPSQCGVCAKCKIILLGRILYSPDRIQMNPEEIRRLIKAIVRWTNKRPVHIGEVTGKSFFRDLTRAILRYGVTI